MAFNEDPARKIPALLHLTSWAGYTYLSRKDHHRRQQETNIFPDLFKGAIAKINPDAHPDEITKLLRELTLKLDFDDLGRTFLKSLPKHPALSHRFQQFSTNTFHVTTELTQNGDEEFAPT